MYSDFVPLKDVSFSPLSPSLSGFSLFDFSNDTIDIMDNMDGGCQR